MKTMIVLLLTLSTLAACAPAPSTTGNADDGNFVGGFTPEQADNFGAGAWAGPPPGKTEAERKARRQYYQGPRANEWL